MQISDNVKDAVTATGAFSVAMLKDWLSIIIMLMTVALLYYRIKKARGESGGGAERD